MKALLLVLLIALAVHAKKVGPISYEKCSGFSGPMKVS